MNQRIIYPTDDGGVAVIIPAAECGLTIEQIAAKDVPAGKPYEIVDVSDIPTDRTFRDAWEYVADLVEEPVAEPVEEVVTAPVVEPTNEVTE